MAGPCRHSPALRAWLILSSHPNLVQTFSSATTYLSLKFSSKGNVFGLKRLFWVLISSFETFLGLFSNSIQLQTSIFKLKMANPTALYFAFFMAYQVSLGFF